MQLTVFGATGQTGRCLVSQALELGHDVTAFVRSKDAFPTRHPHLDVVVGDVANAADVERVVNGQDVVLMSLGVKMGVPIRCAPSQPPPSCRRCRNSACDG